MRLIENTPERIVLRHRPWGIFLVLLVLLLGGVSAVLGPVFEGNPLAGLPFVFAVLLVLGAMWLMVQPSRVVGDARTGTLEILKITLTGRERVTFALSEVAGAAIRSRNIRVGDGGRDDWLAIIVDQGDMAGEHRVTGARGFSNLSGAAVYLDTWLKAYRAR